MMMEMTSPFTTRVSAPHLMMEGDHRCFYLLLLLHVHDWITETTPLMDDTLNASLNAPLVDLQ